MKNVLTKLRPGILSGLLVGMIFAIGGCSGGDSPHPLDPELARSSVRDAMDAWVAGKTPADIKAEMIVGDPAWEKGRKLVAWEIRDDEEFSDGSNLHISVVRKFDNSESKVTYIVGTSPVVTIFPQ